MNIFGYVRGRHTRRGKVLHEFEGPNLVVNAGRTLVKSIFAVGGGTRPSHLAVGDDGTSVDANDTKLANEVGITREALAAPFQTSYSILYYTTIDNDITQQTIREIGLFNAVAAGTMLARFLCQDFIFAPSDDLLVNWTITFGD